MRVLRAYQAKVQVQNSPPVPSVSGTAGNVVPGDKESNLCWKWLTFSVFSGTQMSLTPTPFLSQYRGIGVSLRTWDKHA